MYLPGIFYHSISGAQGPSKDNTIGIQVKICFIEKKTYYMFGILVKGESIIVFQRCQHRESSIELILIQI